MINILITQTKFLKIKALIDKQPTITSYTYRILIFNIFIRYVIHYIEIRLNLYHMIHNSIKEEKTKV